MRYSSESGKIVISVKEFINIARRSIGGSLSRDENEPIDRMRNKSEFTLRYGFNLKERDFTIEGSASDIKDKSLRHDFTVEGRADRPSHAEISQARGEAFLLGKMYCELTGCELIEITVCYISRDGSDKRDISEWVSKKKLDTFFNRCLINIAIYAEPEVERVTSRLPSLKTLKFPYPEKREGQSDFIKSVYHSLSRGGSLFAAAPTGTGKTVSVLYPALRALGDDRFDKIFYLTPKGTANEAVRECVMRCRDCGADLRCVILSSKEKSCHLGMICREGYSLCALSECKRLPDAVLELYKSGKSVTDLSDILPITKKYSVCPYEAALAYAEVCDLVVCDINYLFDPVVYIRRFFTDAGRYAFLIDEAHNLPDRAREMYSQELDESLFDTLIQSELISEDTKLKRLLPEYKERFTDLFMPYLKEEIRTDKDGKKFGFAHLSEIPPMLYDLIGELYAHTDAELIRAYNETDENKNKRIKLLRDFLYTLKSFSLTLEEFDGNFKLFLHYTNGKIKTKLFCVDPGRLIKKRLDLGHGSVFFSATLSPISYYKSVLGADRSSEAFEISSPFDPSQLSVSIMDSISTRYSERDKTLPAVCKAIAAALSAKRGNYMVFAPSFEYCAALSEYFKEKYPKIKIIAQKPNMTKAEKDEFLNCFKSEDSGYLVGFCVMGGIYSEGVDLVGDSLIGAIVVGIGMPSLSVEREAMAEYYQDKYEEGKTYAYIYPGMNRVLQAAGRVIRTETDRGIILLIDDRFNDPVYKKSIPKLWKGLKYIANFKELNERIKKFWSEEE